MKTAELKALLDKYAIPTKNYSTVVQRKAALQKFKDFLEKREKGETAKLDDDWTVSGSLHKLSTLQVFRAQR
jgi:hypothetical protein